MHRMGRIVALGGLVVAGLGLSASSGAAQGAYGWAGAGLTLPMGDTKDVLKTGWLLDVGLGYPLMGSERLSVQLGGMYGGNSAKVGDGSSKMYGVVGNLLVGSPSGVAIGWYIYGGGGMLSAKPDQGESDSNGMYQIGGGLSKTLNPEWSLWGDVRYMSSGSGSTKLTFLPIVVGLTCNFGTGG